MLESEEQRLRRENAERAEIIREMKDRHSVFKTLLVKATKFLDNAIYYLETDSEADAEGYLHSLENERRCIGTALYFISESDTKRPIASAKDEQELRDLHAKSCEAVLEAYLQLRGFRRRREERQAALGDPACGQLMALGLAQTRAEMDEGKGIDYCVDVCPRGQAGQCDGSS